ncbi:energy transducer TonB [Massilia sp. R2A-15]|uniref:energy transducer TonB n=1 Tax=Massilia sp. R2A-15 TaxID=3064278 RepID=UPI00273675CC|nr:energy transducer TonB [Massilia sp. R2A-15]WLI88701.1 energy transducer TonB [Massilia sp. R2A-15]
MGAHSFSPYPPIGAPGAAIGRLRGQFTPLFLIAAVHALVLYGIYSGLLHRVAHDAAPAEVFVSLLAATPPPPPEPEVVPPAEVQAIEPPEVTVPTTVIDIAPAQPPASPAAPVAAAGAVAAPAGPGVGAASAPSAAAPAPPATPRTITSGVEYIRPPQPDYPAVSRRLGEQGRVVLRILVGETGLPEQVQVQTSSGFARLDEAGRQAALRAQFKPHLEDGRPVAVYVVVPLNFKLGG